MEQLPTDYPAALEIDYPDSPRDWFTTLLRPLVVISIAIVLVLLRVTARGSAFNFEGRGEHWLPINRRYVPSFAWAGTADFLTEEEGDERIHAAYGVNYGRLVELKRKWDPSNLFRMNKNIPLEGS